MNTMKVKHIWQPFADLPFEDQLDVYVRCEPKVGTRCLQTRLSKAMAKASGRSIRKANTLNGYFNWSECVKGSWHMFRAPLKLAYAKKIDHFDATGKRFKVPVAVPMGPVEYKGECVERRDSPEVTKERKKRLKARIQSGALTPRSKFREPQAPAIIARLAA